MPREFPKKFPLTRGLRPHVRVRDDRSRYLEEIIDGRVDENGVFPLATMTTPFTGISTSISWPTPSYQSQGQLGFILDDTAIYSVVNNVANVKSLFQARSIATPYVLDSADVWQSTSWEEQRFFSDGTVLIFRTAGNSGEKFLVLDDLSPGALGMTHDHRLVLGGCTGTYFNSGSFNWSEIEDMWREVPGAEQMVSDLQNNLFDDGSWLLISDPGLDVNYPYQLFMTLFATPTLAKFTAMRPFFREAILSRQFEFVRIGTGSSNDGQILAVAPLGTSLIVYTSIDVHRLDPLSGGGYQQTRLGGHGILGRGAMASNRTEHLWVDTNNELHITTEGGINELGYDEYLSSLTSTTIVVWDEVELEFRIGDNPGTSQGFIYRGGELTETSRATTGVYQSKGYEDDSRTGEYVNDGDFSSDTNWAVGDDWLIEIGKAIYNPDLDATNGVLTQVSGDTAQTLQIGQRYTVAYTISLLAGTYLSGEGFYASFGNTTRGARRMANGSYTETLTYWGGDLILHGGNDSGGSITFVLDDMSVVPKTGSVPPTQIKTTPMNMASMGLKSEGFVEVESSNTEGMRVGFDFRYSRNASYIEGPYKPGGPFGEFYLGYTFHDAKIKVAGELESDGKIEALTSRYQYADNRTVRGLRGGEAPIPSVESGGD